MLLEKLNKNSDSYTKAKEQYDHLEKPCSIQAINGQFDKEVVVNGEIDTTATVKSGESLSATTTGISAVDSLLASVVNFGRSQQEVASTTVASEVQSQATKVLMKLYLLVYQRQQKSLQQRFQAQQPTLVLPCQQVSSCNVTAVVFLIIKQ